MKKQTENSLDEARAGFTIIELIVVVGIMALIATVMVVNFNRSRGSRNLKIALNQLTTNASKAKSYALSARNVRTNVPAKYYYLQFDTAVSRTSYQIWAIDNVHTQPPTLVETINLPSGIVIMNSTGVQLEQPVKQPQDPTTLSNPQCLQVLFSLPFGKIYMHRRLAGACDSAALVNMLRDPALLPQHANARAVITLQDSQGSATRVMNINGISGTITAQ